MEIHLHQARLLSAWNVIPIQPLPKRLLLQAVAFCVAAHLLLAMAMAASPELHHYFHGDADHDDHECVVTHLIKGNLHDGTPSPVLTVGLDLPLLELRSAAVSDPVWVAPLFLKNGVLEHAPPVLG